MERVSRGRENECNDREWGLGIVPDILLVVDKSDHAAGAAYVTIRAKKEQRVRE